ncbi:DUF429 domain-containing protein [Paraburkholderia bryophila]|uniref:Putative RNase H-like nuclease n=1 Tax=Paraburkholderia bryophila TaxID=420952 RepID=A0A7Y9WRZ2_9BURK|nr:DUF429 domain-containing protein [Paraburkholderia bryophila]NYH26094.1 putative RNase H-like nuclease [Paraburkholderia bryophila]
MTRDNRLALDTVGVDGCKGGWYAAKRDHKTGKIHTRVCASFKELLSWAPAPAVVAIDIPVGLSSDGKRQCDVAAKAALKWPRSASVFHTPVRQTLGTGCYEEACQRHRAVTGQGISKQAFHILKKISEVDTELQNSSVDAARVFEVHPELTFMQLRMEQGGSPGGISESKSKPEGHQIRKALLDAEFGVELNAALAARVARDASLDDIVDAFAALWSAKRIAEGKACKVPEISVMDATGLPMVIHY